jgi:hypothetical protein
MKERERVGRIIAARLTDEQKRRALRHVLASRDESHARERPLAIHHRTSALAPAAGPDAIISADLTARVAPRVSADSSHYPGLYEHLAGDPRQHICGARLRNVRGPWSSPIAQPLEISLRSSGAKDSTNAPAGSASCGVAPRGSLPPCNRLAEHRTHAALQARRSADAGIPCRASPPRSGRAPDSARFRFVAGGALSHRLPLRPGADWEQTSCVNPRAR